MSIEPTEITRTMRCPRCQRTDTHTIDRSIAGEPVACWPCSGEGHRVACVVVEAPIEPTEEQKQAARGLTGHHMVGKLTRQRIVNADDIARLLAEREAKLREELEGERSLSERLFSSGGKVCAENDTLRARVAELENEVRIAWADCHDGSCEACAKCVDQAKHQRDFATARVAELEAERADTVGCEGCGKRLPSLCAVSTEDPVYLCARCVSPMHMEREAQHLADIKALLKSLKLAWWSTFSEWQLLRGEARALIRSLAHYDDAKAAEGGEG